MKWYTIVGITALMATLAAAQATKDKPAVRSGKVTVAIMDFDAASAGAPELGKQITDALTAMLTGEGGFTLVERPQLAKALAELELNQTGLVSPDQATKIGQLVGARILVTGKAFPLDKQLYVTAKIIGTETTLVEGVLVKGDRQADMGKLVAELSEKLATRLRESGPRLVAGEGGADPVAALAAKLKKMKLPKVAVSISERHIAGAAVAPRVDPAVETEVRMLLKEAGFSVYEGDDKSLAKAGVEVVVTGEAFSEFAARIGNLVSCSARIEMKVMPFNDNDHAILYTDRQTSRAADLSENLAAKTALQKGGRAIGIRLLEYFANRLDKPKQP